MNVTDSAGRWLLMHRPRREARVRLLCLPYAGGGASAFRHWPDALTSSIEVCPVQLPGRENRFVEAPFTRAEAVVEAMAPALRPVLDRPYALFGHSMGAMLGFELIPCAGGATRSRCSSSSPPPAPPQLPRPGAPIHALPETAFVEAAAGAAGDAGRIPPGQGAAAVRPARPAGRLHGGGNLPLHAGRAPGCPLSAFGGRSDGAVSFAELAGGPISPARDFRLQMLPESLLPARPGARADPHPDHRAPADPVPGTPHAVPHHRGGYTSHSRRGCRCHAGTWWRSRRGERTPGIAPRALRRGRGGQWRGA